MRIEDFAPYHRYAEIQSGGRPLRMHYVEKGDPKRPLAVLLHGFPELWWSWRNQIDPLVAAGYRVVVPDLRGYNETDKHGPYDIDTLVADVAGLIDHLGEKRALIVGHDWGGGVAWHFAATRPSMCERLVVMNCPHPAVFRKSLMGGNWNQLKKSWYMFFFNIPFIPEWALTRDDAAMIRKSFRGMAFDRARVKDEELGPYRAAVQKPGAASAMLGWYRSAIRDGIRRRKELAEGSYPMIEAPTLLIWAMQDKALGYHDVVPGTEKLVRSLRIETLENCGHFVQTEAPERVNPLLIDFVTPARGTTTRAPFSN